MRSFLALAALPLVAQQQPTFHGAYADAQAAAAQGDWHKALESYQRAVALHPKPAARVIIYGNNLLLNYYPYSQILRCHLELGQLEAARQALTLAQQQEPESQWHALADRLERQERARKVAAEPRSTARPHAPEATPTPEPKADVTPVPEPEFLPPPVAPSVEATKPVSPEASQDSTGAKEKASAPDPTPGPASVAGATPVTQTHFRSRRLFWGLGGVGLVGLGWLAMRLRRRSKPVSKPEPTGVFRDPETIGPYRIKRALGRGGFAATFLAEHERTGQQVALKVLLAHRSENPAYFDRFRQEASLGVRLDHPGIVKILDPGPEQGQPWIAMAYESGETLEQRLKRGPLSLPEVLKIGYAVASAMAYAHTQGVVHRDLKPANIVLTPVGAKILDFGIARELDAASLTMTYAFLGTPLYAAPEVQFTSFVGPEADSYSLGVLLFELLAGHSPFAGSTPFEILEQHRSTSVPDLAALCPGLPAELVALVTDLMAKAPEARPGDARVLEVLQGLQGQG